MDEDKGKGIKIVIYLLSILVVVGLFVVGFIWFFGVDEQSKEDESSNDLEYVELIEDEEEKEEVEPEEDVETEATTPTEEVTESKKPEEGTEASPPTDKNEAETPAGAKTVGSATSSEGANVVGYSYEVANGKFMFEWKVRADGDKYPKAVASVVEKNQIKVVFESLQKDYVAKEEITTQLGSQLPALLWKPTGTGSEYLFKYTAEKAFELKTVDRGEEGRFVILEVDF